MREKTCTCSVTVMGRSVMNINVEGVRDAPCHVEGVWGSILIHPSWQFLSFPSPSLFCPLVFLALLPGILPSVRICHLCYSKSKPALTPPCSNYYSLLPPRLLYPSSFQPTLLLSSSVLCSYFPPLVHFSYILFIFYLFF